MNGVVLTGEQPVGTAFLGAMSGPIGVEAISARKPPNVRLSQLPRKLVENGDETVRESPAMRYNKIKMEWGIYN